MGHFFLQGLHKWNLQVFSKGGLGQYAYWAGTCTRYILGGTKGLSQRPTCTGSLRAPTHYIFYSVLFYPILFYPIPSLKKTSNPIYKHIYTYYVQFGDLVWWTTLVSTTSFFCTKLLSRTKLLVKLYLKTFLTAVTDLSRTTTTKYTTSRPYCIYHTLEHMSISPNNWT
jgi:hypothetical protein